MKNAQITSSSMWDGFHAPSLARLKRVRTGRYVGGWSARHNNHQQWIQFDLRRIYKITMLSTQGRKIVKQWVTRYTLAHSVDCVHFVPYKQRDRLKVGMNFVLIREEISFINHELNHLFIEKSKPYYQLM